MRIGHSSPEDVWTALHTNIGGKLKYSLPSCNLSKIECKSIMFPAIRAALSRSWIAPCILVDFRDGPTGSLGARILLLYHYMGTSRTACIIDQITCKIPLGDIMVINIGDLVIEAVLFGSI